MFRAVSLVLVLVWASAVLADTFDMEYAYTKVMTNCLGEDVYNEWRRRVAEATKTCFTQDTIPLTLSNPVTKQADAGQQRPSNPLYNAESVGWMVEQAKSRVSNFTCVWQRLGYLKNDLSLDFAFMDEEAKTVFASLPLDLQNDLFKAFGHCKEFAMCLPADQYDSPIPLNIQRAMALLKCDKKTRMKVCMKHDLKRHLGEFDISAIPGVRTEDENEVANKLLHILWGIEAKDDFKLY